MSCADTENIVSEKVLEIIRSKSNVSFNIQVICVQENACDHEQVRLWILAVTYKSKILMNT